MLQEHHVAEARRMRSAGHSWREIGRTFGVNGDTVMAAVDPIFAERRRQWSRDSRAKIGRAKSPRPANVSAMPASRRRSTIWELQSEVGRELKIKAITIRTITSAHPTGKGSAFERVPVSLPFVSFLYGEARQ